MMLLLLGACASTINSAPPPPVKPLKSPPQPTPAAANTLRVGLLLPLSGRHAALGQALQNAAQLAVFDDNSVQIELLPRDTGETPAQAQSAFRSLADQKTDIIVGPLFAPQVAALKPEASRRGIPLLALSNDASMAGPGIYLLGVSPAEQIARVTAFACAHGSKQFVALLPTGGYGDVVNTALHDSVRQCPGANLAMRRYDPGSAQLSRQLTEAAATRQLNDTLILAEPPQTLQNASIPPAVDGRHIRLLGTSLWDEDNVGAYAPALLGAWYAVPAGGDRRRFITNFQSAYALPPPRLATLAYDAVAVAAALHKRGLKPTPAALTAPSGFMGVDGIFRLLPNGTVERGLAIRRIAANGKETLDAAPTSFSPRTH